MNKRIRELAEQAGMQFPVMGEVSYNKFDYERFAELLIDECANTCWNSGFADSDAHANHLLYEFNVYGCRSNK